MTTFNWYTFDELTKEQLYTILMLRSDVFVVEQHCPYHDPDGRDVDALHLLGMENGNLVAYLRMFPPSDIENYIEFGRVVTASSVRSKGYGKLLIQVLLTYCESNFQGASIKCSAQLYLEKFYNGFGFERHGNVYDEDGIPHIVMLRSHCL